MYVLKETNLSDTFSGSVNLRHHRSIWPVRIRLDVVVFEKFSIRTNAGAARFLSPFAGDLFPSVANLVAIFLRQAFP